MKIRCTILIVLMVVTSIVSFVLIDNHFGNSTIALIGGGFIAVFLMFLCYYDIFFRTSRREVKRLLPEPKVKKESLLSSKEIQILRVSGVSRQPRIPQTSKNRVTIARHVSEQQVAKPTRKLRGFNGEGQTTYFQRKYLLKQGAKLEEETG